MQNADERTRRPAADAGAGDGRSGRAWASEAAAIMAPVADDVQSLVLAGAGHWIAEQAPEQMVAALTEFLAPYRDGTS